MMAGKRDKLIQIESLTTTRSENGGELKAWAPYAEAWANKRVQSSREIFRAEQLTAINLAVFTTLYIPNVSETMRLICEGKTYNIRAVETIGRELQIVAEHG